MDFNLWEITVLVVLAIIVFGPEKLPELARKAARVLQFLRRIGNDARGQLRKELGDEFADISLADLNPKTFVAKHLLSGEEVEDLRQIRDEAIASGQILKDTVDEVSATAEESDAQAAWAAGAAGGSQGKPAASGGAGVGEPVPTTVPFDPEAT